MIVGKNNASTREEWIKKTLLKIPQGSRILDAGAGERQFESFCSHLNYVAQDFGKYDGSGDGVGLQMGKWDQSNLDITSDPNLFERFSMLLVLRMLEKCSKKDKESDKLLCFGYHVLAGKR